MSRRLRSILGRLGDPPLIKLAERRFDVLLPQLLSNDEALERIDRHSAAAFLPQRPFLAEVRASQEVLRIALGLEAAHSMSLEWPG